MKLLLALLLFSVLQYGCGSSYTVSSSSDGEDLSYAEFNVVAGSEKAEIVFQDDSTVVAQVVRLEPDSTTWLTPKTGMRITVPTHTIKKIVLMNRTIGGLEGAGIGLLVGAGAGLLTAAIWVGDPEDMEALAYVFLPAIGGCVGLLSGTIIGVTSGHTYEYEIVNKTEKPLK